MYVARCLCLQYDDKILQLFVSSLFLAGAFSALVAMVTCKKYGRRFTMICGGAAFIIGRCPALTHGSVGDRPDGVRCGAFLAHLAYWSALLTH